MVDLSHLGAGSLGVWTRVQALSCLTGGQVDALVRSRSWQVLWRGVYADGGYAVDAERRATAAVLAVGATTPGRAPAVAAGRTAARVWNLPLIDDDDPATGARQHLLDDVVVDRHLPRQRFRGRTLRPVQARSRRDDVVRLRSGLRLTSPARTLLDCAALMPVDALTCAVDAALHQELVEQEQLENVLRTRCGAAGVRRLRSAVAAADGRAESPAETLARLLLRPVLPDLEPQVELWDRAMRLVARFDLGDRRVRLAVEADGRAGHAGDHMVAKDRKRDRRAEAYGWTTERVTWFELRREQADVVRRTVQRHTQLAGRGQVA